MTAKQIFIQEWGEFEHGKRIMPMFLEHYVKPQDIVDLMERYGKIIAEKQRELCADNAECEETFNYGRSGYAESFYIVNKNSILNAPEPEF